MAKKSYFCKSNANIRLINGVLVLKVKFIETYVCLCLRNIFQVSSIILTSFSQDANFIPQPQPQNENLTSPLRLWLNVYASWKLFSSSFNSLWSLWNIGWMGSLTLFRMERSKKVLLPVFLLLMLQTKELASFFDS